MWRSTMLPVRIYVADARVLLPIMGFVLQWSWATLYGALAGIALFTVLEWCGLTLPAAGRTVRRWIVGARRPALPAWKKRRFA